MAGDAHVELSKVESSLKSSLCATVRLAGRRAACDCEASEARTPRPNDNDLAEEEKGRALPVRGKG